MIDIVLAVLGFAGGFLTSHLLKRWSGNPSWAYRRAMRRLDLKQ